jgi:hypothetical protein
LAGAQLKADDLTSAVFRALYKNYRLITVGGNYIVVPVNTLVLTGDSLGAIARQISEIESPMELTELMLWEDALPQRRK